MPLVSFRQYARMQGIALASLQGRIKRGTITERAIDRTNPARPKIITEIADEDFKRNASEENLQVKALSTDPKLRPPQPLEPQSSLDKKLPPLPQPEVITKMIEGKEVPVTQIPYAGEDNFDRYRKAKAGTEELKARKLELEVDELEKRLLSKDDVKKTIQKLVTVTREALLNLPGKIAPEVLAINDLIELETKLYSEINQALESLSKIEGNFE